MNIFSDLHNVALYYSLHLLFEKRLGGNLFRPIGLEWFDEGYWKIAEPYGNAMDTVNQFLALDSGNNKIWNREPIEQVPGTKDYYEFEELSHGYVQKAITLEQFKNMPIDIVIASIPEHIKPYKELIAKYHPEAKFIFQMGNVGWDKDVDLAPITNLLASVKPFTVPPTCHAIFYHQEFDLNIFKPTHQKPDKTLVNFVIDFKRNERAGDYYALKQMMTDFTFKSYGQGCDDDYVVTRQEIANIMNKAYMGVHLKRYGDGFGHTLYNWYACGKPVITRFSDYRNRLGEELLVDLETAIDLDQHSLTDTAKIIRKLTPLKHEYMCQQAYQIFKDHVNYDTEAENIKMYLDKLN